MFTVYVKQQQQVCISYICLVPPSVALGNLGVIYKMYGDFSVALFYHVNFCKFCLSTTNLSIFSVPSRDMRSYVM